LSSVTDALNHITSFGYDALDRRISVTNALTQTATSTFDQVGNLISAKDTLGRATTYGYDNLNRRISATDALGQVRSIGYDAVDNVVSTTNELGQSTSYSYDALNRLVGSIDALGHTQAKSYDSEGNTVSSTDGLNNRSTYGYDFLNRQVKVTDAKGGITSTSYDAIGNVTKITDSVGNSTTYLYDVVDRLSKETNQLGSSRSHAYDAVGNQVEMIDRNNRKTTYGYDSLNRRTGENWIGIGGVNLRSIGYTYDAASRLTTESDPGSKYSFGYDEIDRVTSVDNNGTTGVPAVVFAYTYDEAGNVILVADRINGTNTSQTDYTIDQLNRVTKITQSGTGVQNKRVDMTYNKLNQITGLTRFSDLTGQSLVAETNYTYDQNQRLVQLGHKKGANNLASYDYTFDAANKLTKIISSVDGTVDYAYDATNQLTGADHSSQTDEAYQYDANGNRTNAGYQTGVNNQLLTDGQFTYEYDAEGNRTKRTETATGKVTEYVWDYRNRLAGVLFKNASGSIDKNIEYTYDVNNQRIGKKINGIVTERYVIDRNQIALVFDGSGVQKSRYLYGNKTDQVLAEESGSQVRWLLTDHQGTVKDVIDNTGTVIDHVTYDSFGRIVNQTSPIDLRFAYTGREWDSETGQYYYRARYYDAVVGKFIGEDPIGFNAGDTNLSRYVSNSPTNFNDPSGLELDLPYFNPIPLIGQGLLNATKYASPIGTVAEAATVVGSLANQPGVRKFVGDGIKALDRFLVPPVADATRTPTRPISPVTQPLPANPPITPPRIAPPNLKPRVEPKIKPKVDLVPNPNDCEEEKEKCPTRILFRGDSRTPLPSSPALRNGIFNQGFRSRGLKSTTLEDYVFNNADGIFIGTSEIRSPAITFATSNIKTGAKRDGYVYEICDPGKGININERFKDSLEFFRRKYDKQREIAFKDIISNENIKGAYFYDQNRNQGPYYKNPNYKYRP
jgi:RHS repeat-associated protein